MVWETEKVAVKLKLQEGAEAMIRARDRAFQVEGRVRTKLLRWKTVLACSGKR